MVRLIDDLLDVTRITRNKLELRRSVSNWRPSCTVRSKPAARSPSVRATNSP